MLTLPPVAGQASSWLAPAGGGQIIMKERSITGPPEPLTAKYSYREVHVEWGLHRYLMMSLKHREPFQTPYYRDPAANEIEVNVPSPIRFFLFPPKIDALIHKLSGAKVFRERPSTLGVGYAHFGDHREDRSFHFVSWSQADKIRIGATSLIGQLTLRQFFPRSRSRTDSRALLLLEIGSLSMGIEYAVLSMNDSLIEESARFIELPIWKSPARLRVSGGAKYYQLDRYAEDVVEISIRIPINP